MHRRGIIVKADQGNILGNGYAILLGCNQHAVSHLIARRKDSSRAFLWREFKELTRPDTPRWRQKIAIAAQNKIGVWSDACFEQRLAIAIVAVVRDKIFGWPPDMRDAP